MPVESSGHGEEVTKFHALMLCLSKLEELHYYLDATPTHSYMKMMCKYPQGGGPGLHWYAQFFASLAVCAQSAFENMCM